MLIEIVGADSEVRPIRNKETGEVRNLKQIAYADIGQAYPVRIQISVSEPLSPGTYEAEIPYRIGKYDSLEISGFDVWKVRKVEGKKPEPVRASA